MSRHLCLLRNAPGVVTRVECSVRPLAGGQGLWTLLCAAGLDGAQPSTLRANGPFHGPGEAEMVLDEIVENLEKQGYQPVDAPSIWALHLQGELRRADARRGHPRAHGSLCRPQP